MSPSPIHDRVPTRVDDADPSARPLTPQEYFVYLRVDGALSVGDLGEACGLSAADATAAVMSLSKHGLVIISGTDQPAGQGLSERPPMNPLPTDRHSDAGHGPSDTGRHPSDPGNGASERLPTPGRGILRTKPPPPGTSRALYDPSELEEDGVALEPERRLQVLDTFYRLGELDHYALLGVERDAEKKEIRDGYFSLAKVFHPDTRFGKELGSYKTKMEVVFRHLTDAYEVLSKKKARAEYDEYIGLKSQADGALREMEEAQELAEAIERGEPPPPSEPPAPEAPARPPAPAHRKPDPRALMNRMAKQLAAVTGRHVSSKPPRRVQSAPPPAVSKEERLKGLRRSLRSAAALRGSAGDIKKRQLAAAAEAEGRKDWVGMANALRLALAADPNDAELRERHLATKERVARHLADSYEHQARYEEEHTNWEAAARSWRRVAAGREGDPRPLVSAARALLTAGKDLHEARDLAQQAKDMAPAKLSPLIVLAEIYLQSGLTKNAKREINAALKLDPNSEIVKNLQRTLKG